MNGGGQIISGSAGDHAPILVRTVVDGISKDAISYWQNMTCFFNQWWYPQPERITFPFCFFHITKYSESHSLETSKKRIIMYDPPEERGAQQTTRQDPVRRGLMQTMVDNTVIQPKTYNIEAIVPFLPFGRYVNQGVFVGSVFNALAGQMGAAGISQSDIDYLERQLNTTGMLQRIKPAQRDQKFILEQETQTMTNSDAMVNKNSLDQMFETGAIVQFKTWMGFDYKYVIIRDKTIEKRAGEDDVWRVSMTLEEMPILSLTPIKGSTAKTDRTWTMGVVNRLGNTVGLGRFVTAGMPWFQNENEEGDNE
jgi:hypothetical protein